MDIDLARMHIEKLIVHDVPKRIAGTDGELACLSEVESPLTQDLDNFFCERVGTSLASAAFEVEVDPHSHSPMPGLILDHMCEQKAGFVGMSQEMAKHLYRSSTGVNPAGLLIVIQASVVDVRALAILKLEKEVGVRAQQYTIEGKATFNIQHIHDLMLTERTKVFKVGLFVQEGEGLETIRGKVSDKQRGLRPRTEVAEYFLKDFLGCRLRQAPEVVTSHFFQTSQAFFEEQVEDAATKARYQIGLIATLGDQEAVVRPREFATRHLDTRDRRRYLDALEAAQVPTTEFYKENNLISNQLKKIQWAFESGVILLAPPETIENGRNLSISSLGDDRTRVVIEDRLKSVYRK